MQDHGHRLSPPKNEKNRSDKHHYGGFPYHNTFRSAKVYDFKAPRLCFFKASAPNKTTFSYDGIHHVRKKHQSRSFDSHLTQKKHLRRYVPSLLSFPMTDFRPISLPLYIQRLVSLRVLTAFPFHRSYLGASLFAV